MAKKKRKGKKARSRQQHGRQKPSAARLGPRPEANDKPASGAQPDAMAKPDAGSSERGKRRARRRRSRYELKPPPRGAFIKGALLGFVAGIPLFAGLAYALTLLGLRGFSVSFEYAFTTVAALCSIPLILSAGGVGRLAARAAIAPERGGLTASVIAAARALAVAGVGITLIALIALGGFPQEPRAWALASGFGLVGGAALGALIGAWAATGGDSREEVGETTAPE